MQVRDVMNPTVVSIAPQESVALAARLLARHNVGALPVCSREGTLHGMVTDRDLVLRCVAAEEDPRQVPVRQVMSRHPAQVAPGDDVRQAAQRMARQQVRRLPVVEGGKVVGMVSLWDLAQCRQFDMEASKALCEISDQVKHGYVE